MAYDIPLKTDPTPLPLKPAILILLHRRKKAMFIAYTTNARGRAAVLATMIRHRKTKRNHLRDLPEGDIRDFTVIATKVDLDKREADDAVVRLQRHYEKRGFRMFGGPRSALPKVLLNGKRMTIVDAMEAAGTKDNYQTVYRRIQRGWPVKQALGMEERA
jgi:hypothetical protein